MNASGFIPCCNCRKQLGQPIAGVLEKIENKPVSLARRATTAYHSTSYPHFILTLLQAKFDRLYASTLTFTISLTSLCHSDVNEIVNVRVDDDDDAVEIAVAAVIVIAEGAGWRALADTRAGS